MSCRPDQIEAYGYCKYTQDLRCRMLLWFMFLFGISGYASQNGHPLFGLAGLFLIFS